jgi:5,5'-dehydrodivanillate O-demethylase
LESPESTFAQRVKIAGHHVQELAGLVWGYIGPEPTPLLPRWHPLVEEHAIRGIGTVMLDCNWLQVQENSVDTPHSTYTHGYFSRYIREVLGIKDDIGETRSQNTRRRRMRYAYDPFEYGIIKRNLHEGESEDTDNWGSGHPLLFPNITVISGLGWKNMQIRVPIDDEHTWIAYYYVYLLHPEVEAPAQDPVPAYEIPVPRFPTHYAGQDCLTWMAQGVITDRVHERLTELDKGIILFRKMLQEQIEIVRDGGEPMNTFRDPEKNQYIEFPLESAGSESYGVTEGYRAGTIISSTHTEQFSPAGKVVDELLTRSAEASRRHLSAKPS